MLNQVAATQPSTVTRLSVPLGKILLNCESTVPHTQIETWSVIADYDNLGKFMPHLESRTIGRKGSLVLVEQIARSSLLPILGFRLSLEFERISFEQLNFRRVAGNLMRFEGFWAVQRTTTGSRIIYHLTAQHGYPIPPILLSRAIRTDTEKIMPSITAELHRRYPIID